MSTASPAKKSSKGSEPPKLGAIRPPVMRVTDYDRVSSWLLAIVFGLVLLVAYLVVDYLLIRPQAPVVLVPIDLVEDPGGSPDGAPDETLSVESPEPENPNASPAEQVADQVEVAEVLENVVEFSNQASQQEFEPQPNATGVQNVGVAGSSKGTGRRGLGFGKGKGGFPREMRWYIQFSDRDSLDEYARQLDFFGIELGAISPEGKITFVSQVSGTPKVRTVETGKGENRLYMIWQGGVRQQADRKLFTKAGVRLTNETIFHFYPPKTETQLATIEFNFKKRKASDIRRTYFNVVREGNGYNFVVANQTYIR